MQADRDVARSPRIPRGRQAHPVRASKNTPPSSVKRGPTTGGTVGSTQRAVYGMVVMRGPNSRVEGSKANAWPALLREDDHVLSGTIKGLNGGFGAPGIGPVRSMMVASSMAVGSRRPASSQYETASAQVSCDGAGDVAQVSPVRKSETRLPARRPKSPMSRG